MSEIEDLVPVTLAAQKVGVARNTMLLAAKNGKIKATRIGKGWFVYASDLERWKREEYRPNMAFRFPAKGQHENDEGKTS
jgi:excisionase family DNA binding protein